MKHFQWPYFSHRLFLIRNNPLSSVPSSATFFGLLSEAPKSIFYFHFEIKLQAYLLVKFPLKCPYGIYSRADYKMRFTHGMRSIYLVQMETLWNCTQIRHQCICHPCVASRERLRFSCVLALANVVDGVRASFKIALRDTDMMYVSCISARYTYFLYFHL